MLAFTANKEMLVNLVKKKIISKEFFLIDKETRKRKIDERLVTNVGQI